MGEHLVVLAGLGPIRRFYFHGSHWMSFVAASEDLVMFGVGVSGQVIDPRFDGGIDLLNRCRIIDLLIDQLN